MLRQSLAEAENGVLFRCSRRSICVWPDCRLWTAGTLSKARIRPSTPWHLVRSSLTPQYRAVAVVCKTQRPTLLYSRCHAQSTSKPVHSRIPAGRNSLSRPAGRASGLCESPHLRVQRFQSGSPPQPALPSSLAFLVVAMLHQRAGRNDGRRSPTPLPARSSAGFALAGPVLAGNKSGAEDSSDRSGFVHSTVDGRWTQSGCNSDRCRLTLAVRTR